MDRGSILEVGNHDQLMKNKGKYKELWDIQRDVDIGNHEHTFNIDITTLKRIPLVADLDNDYQGFLGKEFDIQQAEEGEVIIHKNTTEQNYYIIASSIVSIIKEMDKQHTKLAKLDSGDFSDEILLIKTSQTTEKVTVDQYCVLLRLSKSKFNAFFESLPENVKKQLENAIKTRL